MLRVDTWVGFLGVIFDRNNRFVRDVDHMLGMAKRAFFAFLSPLSNPLFALIYVRRTCGWSWHMRRLCGQSISHSTRWRGFGPLRERFRERPLAYRDSSSPRTTPASMRSQGAKEGCQGTGLELASTWRLRLSWTLLGNDMLMFFHRPYDGSDVQYPPVAFGSGRMCPICDALSFKVPWVLFDVSLIF